MSEPPATGFPSEEESFLQQTLPALQGFSGLSLFSPGRAAWLHAPVLCHMPISAFNPYGKPHPQGYTTGDRAGFLPTAPLPQTVSAAGSQNLGQSELETGAGTLGPKC